MTNRPDLSAIRAYLDGAIMHLIEEVVDRRLSPPPLTKDEVQELLRDSCPTHGDYWQRVADRFNTRMGLGIAHHHV